MSWLNSYTLANDLICKLLERDIKYLMKIEKNITVCFDTNVYREAKYNFEGRFYTIFKDLKKSYPNLRVYVEPVIYNEVLSHLRDQAIDITKEVESLRKKTKGLDLFSNAMETLKTEDLESQCFTEYKEKFEAFIKFFSDEEIDKTFNYDMSDILSDYFKGLPPFENKKSKKNEFPDAFIIQGLKNKFQNQDNLFIVSSDTGFNKAIKDKIPNCRIFSCYPDCADYLNSQLEEYEGAHKIVDNLIDAIKESITVRYSEVLYNLVSIEYAEKLGLEIDATNYERRGFTVSCGLDEIAIDNLRFNDYRIRIFDINGDKGRITAEIIFMIDINISGYQFGSNDLFLESHTISYKVDIEVNSEYKDLITISDDPIVLNKDSLTNRIVKQHYFGYNYDEPSLHPKNNIYTITCNHCGYENNYDAPSMEDFETSSGERSMGYETLYELTIQENCQNCKRDFILEIIISMYPYLTLETQTINCEGGETDLSFVVS